MVEKRRITASRSSWKKEDAFPMGNQASESMSEYRFVERPFLTQLEALGWTVVDQGGAMRENRRREAAVNA